MARRTIWLPTVTPICASSPAAWIAVVTSSVPEGTSGAFGTLAPGGGGAVRAGGRSRSGAGVDASSAGEPARTGRGLRGVAGSRTSCAAPVRRAAGMPAGALPLAAVFAPDFGEGLALDFGEGLALDFAVDLALGFAADLAPGLAPDGVFAPSADPDAAPAAGRAGPSERRRPPMRGGRVAERPDITPASSFDAFFLPFPFSAMTPQYGARGQRGVYNLAGDGQTLAGGRRSGCTLTGSR
jgi:hypothetical protein